MNKTIKLAFTGLFACHLTQPLPLLAESYPTDTLPTNSLWLAEADSKGGGHTQTKAKDAEEVAPIEGFTLQHRVNDDKSLATKVKPNPLVLLQTFKKGLVELLKQHDKPLEINSEINLIGSPKLTKEIGALPTLTVQTTIDAQGQGQSNLLFPEFLFQQGKESLVWKGFTGQMKFTETFDSFETSLNVAELTTEEKGKFSLSVSPFTVNSTLDADFFLNQMNFNMPVLTLVESKGKEKEEVKLTGLIGNFSVEKTDSGLELGSGMFKVGQLGMTGKTTSKFSMNGLSVSASGAEQDNLVNYTVRTQIDQLVVNDLAPGGSIDMSSTGNLEFRHLDVEVIKELQKTMRNLQMQSGAMSEEMLGIIVLGKFMELAPAAIAKSPELGLSGVNLKTQEGQLQGEMTIGLEGKKVTSLKTEQLLEGLHGQAEFQISKTLLEKFLSPPPKSDKKSKSQKEEMTAQQQIDSFLEEKWLVDAGAGNYKVVAILQDRKFVLNGQEIPLPFLNSPAPEEGTAEEEMPNSKKKAGD